MEKEKHHETEHKDHEQTKRYMMIELSCDAKACSPCTYPNCQRFARTKKIAMPKGSKIVGVHELKGGKALDKMIKEREKT